MPRQQLELGNSRIGQYFTPHHICELMAEITLMADLAVSENVDKEVAKKGSLLFLSRRQAPAPPSSRQ